MSGIYSDEPTFKQNITYKDIDNPKICCFKVEYPRGTLKFLDKHKEGDFIPIKVFSNDIDDHFSMRDVKLKNNFRKLTLESVKSTDFSKDATEDFIDIKDIELDETFLKRTDWMDDLLRYKKEYSNQLVPIEKLNEKDIRFELNRGRFYIDNNKNGFHDLYLEPLNNIENSYAFRTKDKDIAYIDFKKVEGKSYLMFEDLPRMYYFNKHLVENGFDRFTPYDELLNDGIPMPRIMLSEIEIKGMKVDDFYKKKDNKVYGVMNLLIAEEDFNTPFLIDYSKYPKSITNKDEIYEKTSQISIALSKNYEIFTVDESKMFFEENYWKEIVWKNIEIAKDEVLTREDLLKAMSYNFKDFYNINTDAIQFYTKVKVKEESGSGMDWSPAVYEEASIEDILPINFSELNEEDLAKFKEMTITARLSQEDINGIGGEYTFKNFNEFKVKVVDAGLGKVYKGYDAHDFGAYKKIYRTLEEATNKECICEKPTIPIPPIETEVFPIEIEPTPPVTEEKPIININIPPNPPTVNEKPKVYIPQKIFNKVRKLPKTGVESNLNFSLLSYSIFLLGFLEKMRKK